MGSGFKVLWSVGSSLAPESSGASGSVAAANNGAAHSEARKNAR